MVETGLGLLSRCRSRAGFLIPLLEQGWVCYPAAGAGLGLLSRCCTSGFNRDCVAMVETRLGFVISLSEQGWVCYPAVGAELGLLSRCWSRRGCYPAAVGLIAIVW